MILPLRFLQSDLVFLENTNLRMAASSSSRQRTHQLFAEIKPYPRTTPSLDFTNITLLGPTYQSTRAKPWGAIHRWFGSFHDPHLALKPFLSSVTGHQSGAGELTAIDDLTYEQ